MNQSVKQQWIAALRSGDYQQGFDTLRDGAQYCVMGVLCDLHAQTPESLSIGGWIPNTYSSLYSYLGLYGTPSLIVHQWAGLGMRDMIYIQEENDNHVPFDTLADYIEANL